MSLLSGWYAPVILILVLVHLVVAPYTKVEESFNIQAIHDLLQHGIPVSNGALKFRALFDHMTFSGSVPRTFVGALVIAGLSKPFVWLGGLNGLARQMIARAMLGLLNVAALATYIGSIRRAYGDRTAVWYTLFQASQFHVFFYASRTLPNMFAFCLSTFASTSFFPSPTASPGNHITRLRRAFFLLTFAAVVFRSELVLLIASHAGLEVIKSGSIDNAFRLVRIVILPSVIIAGLASIIISVPTDTYMWQSSNLLLPELTAFLYNIFPKDHLGASAWGTSPWHWYFTSAIPRLISGPSLLLLPYGLIFTTQRLPILDVLIPPLAYTMIYSILPHKETRFLFPIVPQLTLATAIPASYLSLRRNQISKLLTILLIISSIITAIFSHAILLPLSAQTYPGAKVLQAVHSYHASLPDAQSMARTFASSNSVPPQIHVHLTNLALQSGVTRFLEQPPLSEEEKSSPFWTPLWVYDKSPTVNVSSIDGDAEFWSRFDYVVVEASLLPKDGDLNAWIKIASIPSLRRSRPRILRSGDTRGCLVLSCRYVGKGQDGLHDLLRTMYGESTAWIYGVVHDVLREGYGVGKSLTGGFWLDWGLEERLVVLRRQEQITDRVLENTGVGV